MGKSILIASARIDEPTYKPVGDILERNGYSVVVYQTDRVLSGEDQYMVALTSEGELSIDYNGVSILPERISAAWYRKVGSFDLPYKEPQIAKQLYVNNEVRHLHDMVWSLYPENMWMSSPKNLARAGKEEIVEASPEEFFWSIGANGTGQNMLSKLWTKVREGRA